MPRLKAVRVGISAAPYIEAELELDASRGKETSSRGMITLFIYTVEGLITEQRFMEFLARIESELKSRDCRIHHSMPPSIMALCGSKIIQASGSTMAEELGLNIALSYGFEDMVPDDPGDIEEITEELGLGTTEAQELYIYAEITVTAPLRELDWVKENVSWILDSMDMLEARYQAKIIIDETPKKPDVIKKSLESAKVMILNEKTSIYFKGPHHLRDPKLYSIIKKAFRRWF